MFSYQCCFYIYKYSKLFDYHLSIDYQSDIYSVIDPFVSTMPQAVVLRTFSTPSQHVKLSFPLKKPTFKSLRLLLWKGTTQPEFYIDTSNVQIHLPILPGTRIARFSTHPQSTQPIPHPNIKHLIVTPIPQKPGNRREEKCREPLHKHGWPFNKV
jgi:hypothetical protein